MMVGRYDWRKYKKFRDKPSPDRHSCSDICRIYGARTETLSKVQSALHQTDWEGRNDWSPSATSKAVSVMCAIAFTAFASAFSQNLASASASTPDLAFVPLQSPPTGRRQLHPSLSQNALALQAVVEEPTYASSIKCATATTTDSLIASAHRPPRRLHTDRIFLFDLGKLPAIIPPNRPLRRKCVPSVDYSSCGP